MEWAVPRARSNSLSHSDGRDLSVDVLLAQHAMVMESQKSRAQELMNKLRNVSAAHLNTLEPSRAEAAVKKSGSVDPAHSHSHSQLQSQPQLQSQTQAQAQAQVQAQAQAQAQAQDKFLFQRRQQPVPKFKIAETAGYGWQRSERRGDMARGIGAGRRTPAPPSEFEAGAASSEQRFSVFESKFVDLNAEMDQTNELSDDSLGGGDAETAVNPSRAFHKEWIDEASAPRLPVQPSEAMIRAQRILEKFATKSPHSMNSEHDVTTSHADFDHIRKVDSQSAPQAHAERELLASSDSDKTKFPKSARTARAVAKLPPVPTLTWVKSLFRAQDRLKTGCVGGAFDCTRIGSLTPSLVPPEHILLFASASELIVRLMPCSAPGQAGDEVAGAKVSWISAPRAQTAVEHPA